MLRTHRSLKAYCATPVMKMKDDQLFFFIFPSNGAQLYIELGTAIILWNFSSVALCVFH
jgi:hypothetical protein